MKVIPRFLLFLTTLFALVACTSRNSSQHAASYSSVDEATPVVGDGLWNLLETSSVTVTVRERLFGIWKSTSLSAPVVGWVNISDGSASGELRVNLGILASDEERRDDYLRTNVFSDPTKSVMICSLDELNLDSADLKLPWAFSSICTLGSFTSSQSWSITKVVGETRPTVLLDGNVDLDVYGVPDISQEPIVKVARNVSVAVVAVLSAA